MAQQCAQSYADITDCLLCRGTVDVNELADGPPRLLATSVAEALPPQSPKLATEMSAHRGCAAAGAGASTAVAPALLPPPTSSLLLSLATTGAATTDHRGGATIGKANGFRNNDKPVIFTNTRHHSRGYNGMRSHASTCTAVQITNKCRMIHMFWLNN